ncbi:MAG: NAD-dependent epimerase/dehydratase family protein [Alphaproteobacteria bacterium]|nr:NAD-dependent epimerase/dehydratase family protein [Alphaproteobacteria bacterium]
MRIFVTGASGFVGGAATKAFVRAGHAVTAMSRSERSDFAIRALGATPVRCDLQDVTSALIGNAETILHCAAFVEAWGPPDAWRRFNVDGTQRMLTAAKQAGARRFIHIGTEAALLKGQSLRDVDETYPLAPNSPYPYSATKAQAEMLVRAANADAFTTLILRPRFIWGPGDLTLLPMIEQMAASGQWSWINHGRAITSTTHIDNLVAAIECALTRGGGGEAYFVLDDGVRSMRDMITAMAATRGLTLADRSLPSWLADTIAGASAFAWRTFGLKGEPPLTPFAAMVMSRDCILRDEKARRELGYRPVVTMEEGMKALAAAA